MDHPIELSKYERVLVDVVLIGCTKIVSALSADNPKVIAETVNIQKKQAGTFSTLLYILLNPVSRTPFRPHSLKQQVPIGGRTTVDSHIYEIISQNLPRLGVLQEHMPRTNDKSQNVNQHNSTGGPKKEYKVTEFIIEIDQLLDVPAASYLIYELLHSSAILYKYMKTMKLTSYYIMKLNKDNAKEAWAKCSSILSFDSEKIFYTIFEQVQNLSEEELEVKADTEAIHYIKTHKHNDYRNLFNSGAIFFFA